MAGLAAAWRLRHDGFRVALLEAGERPGGRARSERVEGFALEALPSVLTHGDRRLLAWIGEVGARDDQLPLRPLVTAFAQRGALHEVEVRRLADVRRVPGLRLRDALRLVRLPRLVRRYGSALDFDTPEAAARFDDRSVADFCRLYFGRSLLDRWVAPRLVAASLGDPHEMSRMQLLRDQRLHGHALAGLLRGSLAEVAEAAAEALRVRLGTPVAAVEGSDRGVRVTTESGRVLEADAAVVATPAGDAVRLADPVLVTAEREGLGAVRHAPALTVAVGLCRALGSRPQLALVPRSEGSPLAAALLEPGLHGGRVPPARSLALLRATPAFAAAHREAPPEAVEKELLGAYEALRPGVSRAVDFMRVLRVERAAPRFDVGRYREIARFERVQRDRRTAGRRVYFAGDHLVHPSWEGALVSAERAAAAVREDLGA